MKNSLKLFLKQKKQYIPDLFAAKVHEKFRGFPVIDTNYADNLNECIDICPTSAIDENFNVDLGKCQFCNECVVSCQGKGITFTNFHHTATTSRENLIVSPNMSVEDYQGRAIEVKEEIVRIFGRSLKLRNVSAAGCNSCELELNATTNVNFDIGRYGIDIVASPKHADGLIITGPISENMAFALEETYLAIPDPKIVILMGSCAISGGVFAESEALDRSFLDKVKVDLYIPGCPAHPLTVAVGILNFLNKRER